MCVLLISFKRHEAYCHLSLSNHDRLRSAPFDKLRVTAGLIVTAFLTLKQRMGIVQTKKAILHGWLFLISIIDLCYCTIRATGSLVTDVPFVPTATTRHQYLVWLCSPSSTVLRIVPVLFC